MTDKTRNTVDAFAILTKPAPPLPDMDEAAAVKIAADAGYGREPKHKAASKPRSSAKSSPRPKAKKAAQQPKPAALKVNRLKRPSKNNAVPKVVFSQRIDVETANRFYEFGHRNHSMGDVLARAAILLERHGMKDK